MKAYESNVMGGVTQVQMHRIFPNDVIFTAHEPYSSFFKDMVSRGVKMATGKEAMFTSVDPSLIEEICQGAGNDIYLALAARFFHKLHGCGEL
jgi:hypothetical protein